MGEEYRAAMAERNRPKVGRMARLRGEVENAEALTARLNSPAQDRIKATVDAMRALPRRTLRHSLKGRQRNKAPARLPVAILSAGLILESQGSFVFGDEIPDGFEQHVLL